MENENCLNKVMFDVTKVGNILQLIIISLCMFLVPLTVPAMLDAVFGAESVIANNSQFVVGAIVNTAIIVAALNVKGWKNIVGLVTLPSISALTSGLVLNISSIFTVYMIPAIWIGNFAIIYALKYLYVNRKVNYVVSVSIGILAKVAIIFVGFNILTMLVSMPAPVQTVLSTAMGVNQLITALIGSVIGYITVQLFYNNKQNN